MQTKNGKTGNLVYIWAARKDKKQADITSQILLLIISAKRRLRSAGIPPFHIKSFNLCHAVGAA